MLAGTDGYSNEPHERTLFHGWWRSWDVRCNGRYELQGCMTETSTPLHVAALYHSKHQTIKIKVIFLGKENLHLLVDM